MKKKHRAARAAVFLAAAVFCQEAFMSSFDIYRKDFPGFTAGGSVHLPKMEGGADAGMMSDRMTALAQTIDGAANELAMMEEYFRTGTHPYTKVRTFLTLDGEPDFDTAPATIIDLRNKTDGEYVPVPISLHVKKNTAPTVAVKAAADYVIADVFRRMKHGAPVKAGAPLNAEALDNALMMLVWTFRPEYDRYTEADSFSGLEGPGYVIRLHANLTAVLEASFLERTVKAAASPAASGEPVPGITGRILQAFLKGRAVDMGILKDLNDLTPDIQAAYLRLIVTLLPARNWPDLERSIIPWAKVHLGSEADVLRWLEELALI